MYVLVLYLYCPTSIEVQWPFRGIREEYSQSRGREGHAHVTYKIYSNGTDIAVGVCIIL